jgi:uncharacterized membrane protein YdcZ (DUF606 family)
LSISFISSIVRSVDLAFLQIRGNKANDAVSYVKTAELLSLAGGIFCALIIDLFSLTFEEDLSLLCPQEIVNRRAKT